MTLRRSRARPRLCLAVCLAAWVAAIAADGTVDVAADVTVTFEPNPNIFACNEETFLSLTLDAGAIDLRGVSFVLELNSTIVRPTRIEPGQLLLDDACGHHIEWLNAADFEGISSSDSLAFDAVGLGCSIDGPGEYLRLWFQGQNIPTLGSPITCRRSTLRTSLNENLAHSCVPGEFRCSPPIPVETRHWGGIKAVFAGLDGGTAP